MPFRRLLSHIRAQEWFTVFIELTILILGVFLGLQANNWNQERVERSELASSISAIHSEIGNDRPSSERTRHLLSVGVDSLRWFLSMSPEDIESQAFSIQTKRIEDGFFHVATHAPRLPHFKSFMETDGLQAINNPLLEEYFLELMDLEGQVKQISATVENLQFSIIDPYLARTLPLAMLRENMVGQDFNVWLREDSASYLRSFISAIETQNFALYKHSELSRLMEALERLEEHYDSFPDIPL